MPIHTPHHRDRGFRLRKEAQMMLSIFNSGICTFDHNILLELLTLFSGFYDVIIIIN